MSTLMSSPNSVTCCNICGEEMKWDDIENLWYCPVHDRELEERREDR